MKTKTLIILGMFFGLVAFRVSDEEPWKKSQLMKPQELADAMRSASAAKPIVYNIGPSGAILGSIYIGGTQEKENLHALAQKVQSMPKDKSIVIYCGCCPFNDCPNIRPAFSMLTKKGFTHHKLLELPSNLKVDWIDKGYPMND